MKYKKFDKWLNDHGHSITPDNQFYNEITSKYEKRPFSYKLAFKLSLDSYLSKTPVENFFVNEQFIYAPSFKDNLDETISQTNSISKKPNYEEDTKISDESNDLYAILNLDSTKNEITYDLEKRVSKQKDNLYGLLNSKPDLIDLNSILNELDYKR